MIRMTSAAIAVVFALAAGPVWAQSQGNGQGNGEGGGRKAQLCGQNMMTEAEVRQMREQLAAADSEDERMEMRRQNRERMRMRAEDRGMELDSSACDFGR